MACNVWMNFTVIFICSFSEVDENYIVGLWFVEWTRYSSKIDYAVPNPGNGHRVFAMITDETEKCNFVLSLYKNSLLIVRNKKRVLWYEVSVPLPHFSDH